MGHGFREADNDILAQSEGITAAFPHARTTPPALSSLRLLACSWPCFHRLPSFREDQPIELLHFMRSLWVKGLVFNDRQPRRRGPFDGHPVADHPFSQLQM